MKILDKFRRFLELTWGVTGEDIELMEEVPEIVEPLPPGVKVGLDG